MHINSVKSQFIPLDNSQETKKVNNDKELQRLKKVCADFEAVMLSKLMKSMRQTVGESSLFGEGFGAETYQSMFDTKMAEEIAHGSGFGIGELLYKELSQRFSGEDLPEINKPISIKSIIAKQSSDSNNNITVNRTSAECNNSIIENKTLAVSDTTVSRIQQYHNIIEQASNEQELPVHLVYGVITQESSGREDIVSRAGAKGLMQLMDSTAADLGVKNSFNPEENIQGGVRYLKQMLDRFGETELALAAYNAGPGNVEKYGGIPPFKETQEYVDKVIGYSNSYKKMFDENI